MSDFNPIKTETEDILIELSALDASNLGRNDYKIEKLSDDDNTDSDPTEIYNPRKKRKSNRPTEDKNEEIFDELQPKIDDFTSKLRKKSSVSVKLKNPKDINEITNLLFDKDFFELVVTQTNLYYQQQQPKEEVKEKSVNGFSSKITKEDFQKFLGLLILMNQTKKTVWRDFWSTDPLLQVPIFAKTMSRTRFEQILAFIHFTDNSLQAPERNPDPLYELKPLITYFQKKFQFLYKPKQQLSLNETIVMFRGRDGIKIDNYDTIGTGNGILVRMLCESDSGYICNFKVNINHSQINSTIFKSNLQKTILPLIRNLKDEKIREIPKFSENLQETVLVKEEPSESTTGSDEELIENTTETTGNDEELMESTGRDGFQEDFVIKIEDTKLQETVLPTKSHNELISVSTLRNKFTSVSSTESIDNKLKETTLSILEPYLKLGHHIYVNDSFSLDIQLAELLLEHKTGVCGTVKHNILPQSLREKWKNLRKGDVAYVRKGATLFLTWKKRKTLNILSTIHNDSIKSTKPNRTLDDSVKPVRILSDYERYMREFEKTDQFLTDTNLFRNNMKWYKKVAFFLINSALFNAYKIYCQLNTDKKTYQKFLLEVARNWIDLDDSTVASDSFMATLDTSSINRLSGLIKDHVIGMIEGGVNKRPTRACKVCSSKGKRTKTRYICKGCNVPLHVHECYEVYHTKKDWV